MRERMNERMNGGTHSLGVVILYVSMPGNSFDHESQTLPGSVWEINWAAGGFGVGGFFDRVVGY